MNELAAFWLGLILMGILWYWVDYHEKTSAYHRGFEAGRKSATPKWIPTYSRPPEVIRNLPPVQPERIKGHWIEITSINHNYKCSVCGRLLVNITDGKNNVAKNYPYCHCGADMKGEADG